MEEYDSSSHVVGLLAYHIVNLALQEGCMIVNSALESGRPREYLSMRKNARSDLTYVIPTGEAYADATIDTCNERTQKMESESNPLVTSTPQKQTDVRAKIETGQGDEDLEVQKNDLDNSTSLLISNLFNISEFEGISNNTTPQNVDDVEQLPPFKTDIMGLYVNEALHGFDATQSKETNSADDCITTGNYILTPLDEPEKNAEVDALFYVDYVSLCNDEYEISHNPKKSQEYLQQQCDDMKEAKVENYENTYLTLNRDYDQCSEEEEFPILRDPKGMIMQEIVLLTADTSIDTGPIYDDAKKELEMSREDLAATSGVSGMSRKSGLVKRCRLQGARLLACVRGWWQRNATRKQKERRKFTCESPLPPDARRRSASLLDHRVSGPTPCRSLKCNTINEALINSTRWMDYTIDTKISDCGDFS